MSEPDKLFQLQKLAHKISIEAMKISVDPKRIAIQLPNDYWWNAISNKNIMTTAVYHPESRCNEFKLFDITFYNDNSTPDWMKK